MIDKDIEKEVERFYDYLWHEHEIGNVDTETDKFIITILNAIDDAFGR